MNYCLRFFIANWVIYTIWGHVFPFLSRYLPGPTTTKLTTIPEFFKQSDYFWRNNKFQSCIMGQKFRENISFGIGCWIRWIDSFCSPVISWVKNWEKVVFIISELVVGSGGQDTFNIILFTHFGPWMKVNKFGFLHVNPSRVLLWVKKFVKIRILSSGIACWSLWARYWFILFFQ